MEVNVLGTTYKIEYTDDMPDNMDGCCDYTTKTIMIRPHEQLDPADGYFGNQEYYNNSTLRHELIHAILFESGLAWSSQWAVNETMVDFFAMQFPKIAKIFKDLNVLE